MATSEAGECRPDGVMAVIDDSRHQRARCENVESSLDLLDAQASQGRVIRRSPVLLSVIGFVLFLFSCACTSSVNARLIPFIEPLTSLFAWAPIVIVRIARAVFDSLVL